MKNFRHWSENLNPGKLLFRKVIAIYTFIGSTQKYLSLHSIISHDVTVFPSTPTLLVKTILHYVNFHFYLHVVRMNKSLYIFMLKWFHLFWKISLTIICFPLSLVYFSSIRKNSCSVIHINFISHNFVFCLWLIYVVYWYKNVYF